MRASLFGTGLVCGLDVERALAHPDVVAAFAAATTPVYGVDSRPVDGTVFEIRALRRERS